MSPFLLFLIEISISLITSAAVICTLSKALKSLLEDVCGTAIRAQFWTAYTNVMLVLAPLLTVFIFGKSGWMTEVNLGFFKNALGCTLLGVFAALVIIGRYIMKTIPRPSKASNTAEQ